MLKKTKLLGVGGCHVHMINLLGVCLPMIKILGGGEEEGGGLQWDPSFKTTIKIEESRDACWNV